MAKRLIGHVTCPECDFPDAEVAHDKSGHPYRYCPDCEAQFFTHGKVARSKNMLANMRPVAPAGDPAPANPQKSHEEKRPAPAVKRRMATLLDDNGE